MKMPEPVIFSPKIEGWEPRYTEEQMKQYGRDLLEAAAHIAEGYPKYGDSIGEEIRSMKEKL